MRFRTASCTIVCHAKADHNSSCCLFFFRFVFFLLTEVLPVKKCVESKRPCSQRLKSACGARRIVWYLAVKQHQSARKHTYLMFQNACFNFFFALRMRYIFAAIVLEGFFVKVDLQKYSVYVDSVS